MITEERYVDRTGWERGPWDDEPDRVEWRDTRATPVLPCLIVRGPSGALCGYVGVPPGHPWHGLDGSKAWRMDISVHGGVTYSQPCQNGGHICHAAQSGESEPWWIGFDCAHSGDVSPARGYRDIGEWFASYRNLAYVRMEVEQLADQARWAVKP
jgi:hypothetical protein